MLVMKIKFIQMKTFLLIVFLLIGSLNLWAQDGKVVHVMPGSRIIDVLKTEDINLYPQFKHGTVYFKNGSASAAKLNYNSLTDEMVFIDNKGDTLILTNENTVNYITVDKDIFYYEDGYLRQVMSKDDAVLAVREIWEVKDSRKVSSYNNTVRATNLTDYTTLLHRSGKREYLVVHEELILRKKAYPLYSKKNTKFKRADKKVLQMFGYRSE